MAVWALGINHKTAPLDLRGRFAFPSDRVAPVLHGLRQALAEPAGGAEVETAILSTCNRTEIYCAADVPSAPAHTAAQCAAVLEGTLGWLASAGGVSEQQLRSHSYVLENAGVARHAFRVASGLDSMVLGEAQILGQMKTAVRAAEDAGALGRTLHQLFQRSFAVAKEVRSSTEIGEHSISMAAAAVRLASQLFEDLGQIRILFIGAGEMIELASTHFAAKKPLQITIANRTMERGHKLAARFAPNCPADVMRLADVPERLHEYDAIISCTASTLPIVGLGAVERALKRRRHRPMFMVDLAVPRDIEPEVKDLRDVYLYTVDDLASVVRTAQASRQAAVTQAEGIIDTAVRSFEQWLEQRSPLHTTHVAGSDVTAPLSAVALIQQLNAQVDAWTAAELARAKKMLARGQDTDQVLEALARAMAQKMLHGAMSSLRHGSAQDKAEAAQTVSRLFLRTGSRKG